MRRLNISVTPPVPFADGAGQRVGLLEVRMRGVQNQRLAAAELMAQQLGQPRIPSLRHPRGELNGGLFLGVVVNVEVLGRRAL